MKVSNKNVYPRAAEAEETFNQLIEENPEVAQRVYTIEKVLEVLAEYIGEAEHDGSLRTMTSSEAIIDVGKYIVHGCETKRGKGEDSMEKLNEVVVMFATTEKEEEEYVQTYVYRFETLATQQEIAEWLETMPQIIEGGQMHNK